MILFRLCLTLFCLSLPLTSWSAAAKARPAAGGGVLFIPLAPAGEAGESSLPLYLAPGVGRIRELVPRELPGLSPALDAREDAVPAAVTGTKGRWLRILYDEAGHEGWVMPPRSWRYLSWEEYLTGRQVRLLPGLQKTFYLLRGKPSVDAAEIRNLGRNGCAVTGVSDDWAYVSTGAGEGWIRWRDDNGRLLISVNAGNLP